MNVRAGDESGELRVDVTAVPEKSHQEQSPCYYQGT